MACLEILLQATGNPGASGTRGGGSSRPEGSASRPGKQITIDRTTRSGRVQKDAGNNAPHCDASSKEPLNTYSWSYSERNFTPLSERDIWSRSWAVSPVHFDNVTFSNRGNPRRASKTLTSSATPPSDDPAVALGQEAQRVQGEERCRQQQGSVLQARVVATLFSWIEHDRIDP
jgi:hypothetical protein